MKCEYPGHLYKLSHLDGRGETILQFVQREPRHRACEGVTNQEVLRALIDRVNFLNGERSWEGNSEVVYHLRMALALHEARALMRKVEKGEMRPEAVATGRDGHFILG